MAWGQLLSEQRKPLSQFDGTDDAVSVFVLVSFNWHPRHGDLGQDDPTCVFAFDAAGDLKSQLRCAVARTRKALYLGVMVQELTNLTCTHVGRASGICGSYEFGSCFGIACR